MKTKRNLLLFIIVLVATCLGGSGQAGTQPLRWNWGHPSPQGNTIFGMVFQDDHLGWAVAGGGEILRTDDGGESWRLLQRTHQLTSQLLDILQLADGTLIAGGDGLFRSRDGGYGWEELAVPAAGPFYDLCLRPDGSLSAAGDGGAVVISDDHGDTWRDVGPGSGLIRAHAWISATEAFAVGMWLDLHTTDGGQTWDPIFPSFTMDAFEVFFVSPSVGFINNSFQQYRTDDAGATWNLVPNTDPNPIYHFRTLVLSEDHWLVSVHGEGAGLFETLDAGATWEMLQNTNNTGFTSLAALPGGRVVIGVDNGSILVSDDLGRKVHETTDSAGVNFAQVRGFSRRPDGVLFAHGHATSFGDGPIWLRSEDGGLSWDRAPYPSAAGYLKGVDWLDASRGVLATSGELGVTTDGGDSWTVADLGGMVPGDVALPAADRYFVAGSLGTTSGALYRSRDEGQTWQVVSAGLPSENFRVHHLEFTDADRGLVAGTIGTTFRAYVTFDGGESWSPCSGLPTSDATMLALSLPTTGAAVTGLSVPIFGGSATRSYRSLDGGLSWSWINSISAGFQSIARPEPGVIIGASALGIHRSEDDGQTWDLRFSGATRLVHFRDSREGAAIHPFFSTLLLTEDGGLTWTETEGPLASSLPPLATYSQINALTSSEEGWLVGGYSMRIAVGSENGLAGLDNPLAPLVPGQVRVDAPWPNPINPATDIRFHLAGPTAVTVTIHDLAGRRVRTLLRRNMEAGAHTLQWQGRDDHGRAAASGVYLVRILAGGEQASTKVTVVR